MQAHRILIQILAILALFSAALAIPSLQFNTTLLCTENYWLSINYFETQAGDEIWFSGGVTSSATRIVTFNVNATTAGSGSFGTYIVYPGPSYTYFAQLRRSGTAIYQIELKDTATQACTGLTTTGLDPSKQAVWVADVFRKDTDASARGFFWNSALQTAATAILTNTAACSSWQTNNSPFLSTRGYDTTSTSSCLLVQPTSADAGGFIQYLSTVPNLLQDKWGIMDEVAFAQDTTNRYWVMILATRPRLRCNNKYRSYAEGCDDGNNINNDGCDFECNVEVGWTCTESVLLEGSTCVQSPVPPMTPVAVPVSTPTTTPQGQTPTAGTPTATPTSTPTAVPSATPTAATPTGSTPTGSTPTAATPTAAPQSSTPTGSTPTGQTPTGSTPTGQTPTTQTPSSQTPTGQTPSSQTPSTQTPSSSPSSPSSPQGSTPSSSSPSAGPSGSESPSALSPSVDSPLASQSPDGSVSPSDVTPSSSGPFSPRPSRTPSSSGIVSGSEQITASVMMVIVTMLSVVIAAF